MSVPFNTPNRDIREPLNRPARLSTKPCARCYTPMWERGKMFACSNPVCSRHGVEVKP